LVSRPDSSFFAVVAQRGDGRIYPGDTPFDTAREDTAKIVVVFQNRRQHREGRIGICDWRAEMLGDQFEQRGQRFPRRFEILRRPALFRGGVERREIELLVGCAKRREKIEHLFLNFVGTLIGTIRLVDDDDRFQPERQRLHGDELGLRHRTLGRVHQHQRAIDHRQDTFDFAAEIGMAGGIYDIDANAVPFNRRAFRKDGDPALALLVIGIHDALGNALIVPEGAGLPQQLVDQGRFAMIDMRDDRDITKFCHGSFFQK